VHALIRAADARSASGKVYNVGNGRTTTILQLIAHLNEILHTRMEPVFGPARAGDVRHSQADITLARQDLGYEPQVTFVEGLRRTVDALR
jgi:UDP-glucose 4-epimerase